MKREIRGLIEKTARERKKLKFSYKLYIFLVCLAISIFLWVLVRLSREYYYTVDYRLTYTGVPSMLRLTSVSDTVIQLKLRAQGYDLFMERVFTGKEHSYAVDLQQVRLRHTESGYAGYLLTPSLGYEIVSQTGYPHSFVSTSPDTIHFEFERKRSGRGR